MNYITLNENEPLSERLRTAKTGIECYKVVEECLSPSGRYEFRTFPMYVEIPDDVITGKTTFFPKDSHGEPKLKENGLVTFEEGFIHAYANLDDAVQYMEQYTQGYAEVRPTIYKCVIPQGFNYYETLKGIEPVFCYSTSGIRFVQPILERVNGVTRDYRRMVKQEKKKRFGIVYDESQINGDVETIDDEIID